MLCCVYRFLFPFSLFFCQELKSKQRLFILVVLKIERGGQVCATRGALKYESTKNELENITLEQKDEGVARTPHFVQQGDNK